MIRVFLILVFLSNISFSQNDRDPILWNENYPLSWSDFKAKPDQNTSAAALTASGISFGFSIGKTGNRITKFTTEVECFFYPYESWFKPQTGDDYILKHEQVHFDITELHARKFRQQISQLKPSQNLKAKLNSMYKAISQASRRMQTAYDDETNHSINKERQAYWEKYVEIELKKLEAYKSR